LFTFQLVDAWRKFVNNASKVIMLRCNKNSRALENVFIRNKARYVNWKAVDSGFCEKMEVTRVPPGRPSCITSGTHTTGWEPLPWNE